MKISYKDLTDDLQAVQVAQEKDPLEKYSIDIEGNIKSLPAMKVLNAMESSLSFEDRAQFVKELLLGCKVTIYKNEKKSVEVGVTDGMEWWAVEQFNQDPLALRFLVTTIFTKFLKKYVA